MRIAILAAPYDTGRRDHRMGLGPGRLLERGLDRMLRERGHDVTTDWLDVPAAPAGDVRHAFDLSATLARRVSAAAATGAFPLVLAGNCGVTVGALAGVGAADTAVVWFDAHGDLNTPDTSPSGYLDGMSVAVLTGRCWRPLTATIPGFTAVPDERVVLVGVRDLDPPEAELLRASAVRRVAPDLAGLEDALPSSARRAYLHIDLDVLDPSEGRANQFAVTGGLAVPALQSAVRRIAARAAIAGASFTAYDPAVDSDGRVAGAALAVAGTLAEVLAA